MGTLPFQRTAAGGRPQVTVPSPTVARTANAGGAGGAARPPVGQPFIVTRSGTTRTLQVEWTPARTAQRAVLVRNDEGRDHEVPAFVLGWTVADSNHMR